MPLIAIALLGFSAANGVSITSATQEA